MKIIIRKFKRLGKPRIKSTRRNHGGNGSRKNTGTRRLVSF